MKDGYIIVHNFLQENQIDNLEKFVTKAISLLKYDNFDKDLFKTATIKETVNLNSFSYR